MMQLDFLQDEAIVQPEKPALEKKAKRPVRHLPVIEKKAELAEIIEEIVPKLPASLIPPFISNDIVENDENAKAPGAFKNISETAKLLGVPQHVLRFWESRFSQVKPLKMNGGLRYYRPQDIDILSTIKNLLYKQGYTIKGAKKAFGTEKLLVSRHEPIKLTKVSSVAKGKAQLRSLHKELVDLRDSLKNYVVI